MSYETTPLPEGTIVTGTIGENTFVGRIQGHGGYQPVMGYMYIILVMVKTGSMWKDYDYSCIYVPRGCIQLADKPS
jgi:hypothetical protein